MCCETYHLCPCHTKRVPTSGPKCIRCGDPITEELELMCPDCQEGKEWPAN